MGIDEVKITMLAWALLPKDGGPTPPESTCIFSDGIEFWTGWYKGTHILVKTAGPHQELSVYRVKRWAKLNNLVAIFEGRIA